MKVNTSELHGAALDWAVAFIEGNEITFYGEWPSGMWEKYSENWSQGGPIIERERISVREITPILWNTGVTSPRWIAEIFRFPGGPRRAVAHGATPLIAAMRCYVAHKLGDVVDIPEECFIY